MSYEHNKNINRQSLFSALATNFTEKTPSN